LPIRSGASINAQRLAQKLCLDGFQPIANGATTVNDFTTDFAECWPLSQLAPLAQSSNILIKGLCKFLLGQIFVAEPNPKTTF
jgi:hypothetical protein